MKNILILSIIFLCGCSPTKQANRLLLNHPKEAIDAFRNAYPCDKIKVVSDSSYFKGQIDTLKAMNLYYQDIINSISTDTIILDSVIHDTTLSVKDCSKNVSYWKKISDIQKDEIKRLYLFVNSIKPIHDSIFVDDKSKDKTIKELESKLSNSLLESSKKDRWKWWCLATWALITMYAAFKIYLKFK